MNDLHKVKIESEPGATKIFVDGVQIRGLQSIGFKMTVDSMPVVTLDLVAGDVILDGWAVADIGPYLKESIKKLAGLSAPSPAD